jgi:hypothetical protein
MADEDAQAKQICADIYGECGCVLAGRPACEAMIALVENEEDASDEMARISEPKEQSDG